MSTQNVARFARNVEWDFFWDFQTLCHSFISCTQKDLVSTLYCKLSNLSVCMSVFLRATAGGTIYLKILDSDDINLGYNKCLDKKYKCKYVKHMCGSDKNCIVINHRYLKRCIDSIDLLNSFMLLIKFHSCEILILCENNKKYLWSLPNKNNEKNYKLKSLYPPDFCLNGDAKLN